MDVRSSARRVLGGSGPTRRALREAEQAASLRRILASGAFDRGWYEAQVGHPFPAAAVAVGHYVRWGRRAGLSPHPLFEPEWYDPRGWARAGHDPFAVFVSAAGRRRRPPHPLFDPAVWAGAHPESVSHPGGPLGHFSAVAGEDTPLPLPAAARAAGGVPVGFAGAAGWPRWGPVRRLLLARTAAWRAGAEPPPPGTPRRTARTSVLVRTAGDWARTWDCVRGVLRAAGRDREREVEVVVLDGGSRRAVGLLLAVLTLDPRVRLVRHADPAGLAGDTARALAQATGSTVVLLDRSVDVGDGWLGPVLAALAAGGVVAAQPLLLRPDGTVASAGLAFPGGGSLPADAFAGHPVEDARRAGSPLRVRALGGAVLAARARDLEEVGGLDPGFAGRWGVADLSLRLESRASPESWASGPSGASGAGGEVAARCAVVTDAEAVLRGRPAAPEQEELADRRAFRDRWARRVRAADAWLWRGAGLDVAHHRLPRDGGSGCRSAPGELRVPRPVVVRPPRTVAVGPAAGAPSLRWAVKIAAPAGPRARRWGDTHFAASLGAALERLGQDVVVDLREAAERDTLALDDVVLTLRGRDRVRPQPGRVNLLWVISHPELVTREELHGYDAVFAASTTWAAAASARYGCPVRPLLQATDPGRFDPDAAVPDTGEDVLFVGNSRNVDRPVVRHLVDAGIEVAIYGGGWEGRVPARLVRAEHVPNAELAAHYRAAGVVLNDHWPDMREQGFYSNRLFDAAAAGARVVSDDVPGAAEVFGGLVRTYRDAEELRRLVVDRAGFPAGQERVELARAVGAAHSFDARARVLLDTVLAERAR